MSGLLPAFSFFNSHLLAMHCDPKLAGRGIIYPHKMARAKFDIKIAIYFSCTSEPFIIIIIKFSFIWRRIISSDTNAEGIRIL